MRNALLMILTGIAAVITGQLLDVRNENLGPELALKREASKISKKVSSSLSLIDKFKGDFTSGKAALDLEGKEVQELKRHHIDLFVFRGNQSVFWTTQDYNVQPQFGNAVQVTMHASKYLIHWSVISDSGEFVFSREIITNPEAKFLSPGALEEEHLNKFSINVNPVDNSFPLEIRGLPLRYLVIEQFAPGVLFDNLVLLGLLLISIGIVIWFHKTSRWYVAYLANLLLWAGVDLLFYKNHILWNYRQLPLFAPDVYASSRYFPNLGLFLFHTVLAFVFVLFMQKLLKRKHQKSGLVFKVFMRLLLILVSAFYLSFLFSEVAKLVRDSSIVFDFHEIHLISIYTVLGLLGISLGFGIAFLLLRSLYLYLPVNHRRWWYFVVNLPLTIGTAIFVFIQGHEVYAILMAGFLLFFLSYHCWFSHLKPWFYLGAGLILSAVVTSVLFNREIDRKELELREILGAKLLLQSEREPSTLLQKTEQQLLRDKGIVDYYTCMDETKSDFDKRLRQLYFSDYAEDFEILIYDYNAVGRGYREEHPFSYNDLNSLFTSTAKPVTSYFSLVNERKFKGSFLGKFVVSADTFGMLGIYFVMLKPRVSAAQGRLADVFNQSPLEALFSDNQYSYAFYSLNKLSRRYGQYYYPDTYTFKSKTNLISAGGYSHFSYTDELGNIIVISKPEKSWLQALTGFTILALVCLIGGMLYILSLLLWRYIIVIGKQNFSKLRLLNVLKQQLPPSGSDLFLSSKLQLYVTLVVFATFIVVLFVTINYFKNSYTLRQREFLWNKTNEIANTIGTQANLDALFTRYQTGLVYDLSNYYSTDINIYNASGRLLVSSNDRIYDQDLLSTQMNPEAYRDFTRNGISGFIKDEKVGDLKYISAYYTIFDNDLNVKGYLNLPYFTNRQELYREISSYSTTIINLFALVFALAAIVAYVIAHRITEPLNLIRRQMGLVKLGARNAPISWQHNDEIGLLIAEYNKMIEELEISSNKLAESEREGAWREMAKQVAHEIKNPLTPMKLSLQHLQFAMQRKDPNIDEKIKRTSELLINQIDSLSRMAEEFSAFAKMPDAKTEAISLNTVLDEVVGLFGKTENLTIDYSPIETPVTVTADPHQLNRVFTNIVKNAAQAIPEDRKGLLKVYSEIKNGYITVNFEDNGKGIPPELANKIFSPNFSTKNSGMGLGLAISRKIMEQFRGSIDFISKGDKGTVFFVKLPIAENQT